MGFESTQAVYKWEAHHKPNAALVIYTEAERESEESISHRGSESNDSYLLLSGGTCGEDEFI